MSINVDGPFNEDRIYYEDELKGFVDKEWKEVSSGSSEYQTYQRKIFVKDSWHLSTPLETLINALNPPRESTRIQQIRIWKKQTEAPNFDLLSSVLDEDFEIEPAIHKEAKGKGSDLDTLISFFKGKGTDVNGRTVKQMQEFSHVDKEREHDYIQWLFPLKMSSKFNPNSITLTDEIIVALKKESDIIAQFRASLNAMLAFYGLEWNKDEIRPDAAFGKGSEKDKSQWLQSGNHNYLRLSRILGSLYLLGLDKECQALLACLLKIHEDFPEKISEDTIGYWKKAAGTS